MFIEIQYNNGIFFLQLLGEVEAANEVNIRLKAERMAREREAAKELEKKVIAADGEFDTELTNRLETKHAIWFISEHRGNFDLCARAQCTHIDKQTQLKL